MSISIIQAPRASEPYPWAKFARWLAKQGLGAEEIQTVLENGAEPAVTMGVGCVIDEDTVYPGLPSLEGLTLDDGAEPAIAFGHGGDLR